MGEGFANARVDQCKPMVVLDEWVLLLRVWRCRAVRDVMELVSFLIVFVTVFGSVPAYRNDVVVSSL